MASANRLVQPGGWWKKSGCGHGDLRSGRGCGKARYYCGKLGRPGEGNQSRGHRVLTSSFGLPRWRSRKEYACQSKRLKRHGFDSWVGKILWNRKWQPIPVFLPGEFHGWRRLEGYSLWGRKESDMTELTHNIT